VAGSREALRTGRGRGLDADLGRAPNYITAASSKLRAASAVTMRNGRTCDGRMGPPRRIRCGWNRATGVRGRLNKMLADQPQRASSQPAKKWNENPENRPDAAAAGTKHTSASLDAPERPTHQNGCARGTRSRLSVTIVRTKGRCSDAGSAPGPGARAGRLSLRGAT